MQFVELDRFFCSKHTSDTGKCSKIVSKVKRNRYFRFGDYAKTPKNARVGWGLVESQNGPGGSIFRSPAHLYHHRRCFIRFPQARHFCNTSNLARTRLIPVQKLALGHQKSKKSKIVKTIQTRSRMHSYGHSWTPAIFWSNSENLVPALDRCFARFRGSEFSLRTPKIRIFENYQNHASSIPNAFLWSLTKTDHIVKQFRGSTNVRNQPGESGNKSQLIFDRSLRKTERISRAASIVIRWFRSGRIGVSLSEWSKMCFLWRFITFAEVSPRWHLENHDLLWILRDERRPTLGSSALNPQFHETWDIYRGATCLVRSGNKDSNIVVTMLPLYSYRIFWEKWRSKTTNNSADIHLMPRRIRGVLRVANGYDVR